MKYKDVNTKLLLALKSEGKSNEYLARRFSVSKATIKRRLRKAKNNQTENQIISFAAKLAKLAAESPDGFCRREVFKLVNSLRTKHALSAEKKSEIILGFLRDGGTIFEADEIAAETGLSQSDVIGLLEGLTEKGLVIKQKQLRAGRRGRTRSFFYKFNLLTLEK